MKFTTVFNNEEVTFEISTRKQNKTINLSLKNLINLFISYENLFDRGFADQYVVSKRLDIKIDGGKTFNMRIAESVKRDIINGERSSEVVAGLTHSPINASITEKDRPLVTFLMGEVAKMFVGHEDKIDSSSKTSENKGSSVNSQQTTIKEKENKIILTTKEYLH